jgi:phosphoribosylformylglycinamidine cyclo-ligase
MQDAYSKIGVDSFQEESSMKKLLGWINQTFPFRNGLGKNLLPIGFFANVIDLGNHMGLALSMDGVGTKILVAEKAKKYDTIGIDCIAMNVNDLLCLGAEPISFLDYIAVSKIDPDMIEQLAKGFYEGAKQANVNIPGGELAQVKELLHDGENSIDLVGTAIGIIQTDKIITGKDICPGDKIIGLPSNGIHSNGLTLARKLLIDNPNISQPDIMTELLKPTLIYVPYILPLLNTIQIHGMANITGEGFLNILRLDSPVLYKIKYLPPTPSIFTTIQEYGKIPDTEMFKIYNMGIGYVVIVKAEDLTYAMQTWANLGLIAYEIGEVHPYSKPRIEIEPYQIFSEGEGFTSLETKEK